VFEDIGVKEAVFKQLDAIAKPGAILASNTSTLDVNKIANFTKRPQDVVGMHFFSPANVMKLLEVVRGAATAKDVMATVMQVAKKIKKTAVVSGVCDGFIGNRMIEHYGRVAGFLLEEGATPAQVDKALEKWGMAMGPFRMGDLAGNDIGWAIRKRRYVEKPNIRYAKFADKLCEQGRYGQKTGKGWYLYKAGDRKAIPDPEVDAMLVEYRKELGITPRKISDAEIVERCIYALVNEGARIVEEGIAARASDIDMIYLTGYGFPMFRGGPMLYADEVGLYNVARRMQEFAASSGDAFWEPAPLIAKRGRRRQAPCVGLSPTTEFRRIKMTDAVIVSTARTGLAKSWKGAFNMTHGATLGGHSVKHAVARAKLDPAEVEDVLMGCATPEGATAATSRARSRWPPACRSPCRAPPSTASAPRACRPSPWPRSASSPAKATSSSPAASRAFPACSRKPTAT
jgi:3-hydroxyacyl-CoA dehydrogenase